MLDVVKIVKLPQITDPRGNLTHIEELVHTPFNMNKTTLLCNPDECHLNVLISAKSEKLIIGIEGELEVIIGSGKTKSEYNLNCPDVALYVPSEIAICVNSKSIETRCLIIAS